MDQVQQDERVREVYLGRSGARQAPMLEMRGLNVFYGESQVLWDVSLDVPAGSVVCLMGRNGVGKTTLLKTIMGLLPARSGRVALRRRRPRRPAAGGAGRLRDRLRARRAARSSRT